ncbi:class I SAM-dependent methyltransferase [Streptomyces goshikiensis]|uniref:class I SAM-dependent methyltransferase n=1 Tax=Streptomyces goshikiensis TaxID=1942 RepID=UPI003675AB39
MHVAPRPDDVIVDVGCGTGSLALLLPRVEPRARVIGVDPDREVLAMALRWNGGSAWATNWPGWWASARRRRWSPAWCCTSARWR